MHCVNVYDMSLGMMAVYYEHLQGSGFNVQGLMFMFQVSWFNAQGLFNVWGLVFMVQCVWFTVECLLVSVYVLMFRVHCLGLGFLVWALMFEV